MLHRGPHFIAQDAFQQINLPTLSNEDANSLSHRNSQWGRNQENYACYGYRKGSGPGRIEYWILQKELALLLI